MTPEKQEVSLAMQRDHLSALELGHGGEHFLEHPPNGVPQSCYKVVPNNCAVDKARPCNLVMPVIAFKLTSVELSKRISANPFRMLSVEVRGRSVWEVD